MRILGLLALVSACSTSSSSGDTYQLGKLKAIAGEHTVAGIDSDRAGGIWIVYRDQTGGYYTPADVWVTHLDASGAKLAEWYFNDDYTEIGGIAYTGDALWVSYSAVGAGNPHLRRLDPATGATLGTFATLSGITDVTYGNGKLYLAYAWNEIYTLDPTTGGLDANVSVALPDGGTERGVAYADGNLWVSSSFSHTLLLVDTNGTTIGSGSIDLLPGNTDNVETAGLQLAWDGYSLIVSVDNQIVWLAARPR